MKRIILLFMLFGIQCSRYTPNVTILPILLSNSPNQGTSNVSITLSEIAFTFDKIMKASTITVNTANTSCSGSLQISRDNFSTCVQMNAAPTASNSDRTFTMVPTNLLIGGSVYQYRVTSSATDRSNNSVTQTTISNGFTTEEVIVMYSTTSQFDGDLGGRSGADAKCLTDKPDGYDNYSAFLTVAPNDEIRDMPNLYGILTNVRIISENNTKIADDWSDLLDESIDVSLEDAGVVSDWYWTGSTSTGAWGGSNSLYCATWDYNTIYSGTAGYYGETNDQWLDFSERECDGSEGTQHLLCLAYQASP